jgi:ABC-2 type transport system permease protein
MTPAATLAWFARHELTLAWRDWIQMMSGGHSVRDHAITAGTLGFIAGLHWLAYIMLQQVFAAPIELTAGTLLIGSAIMLTSFCMMLSQAIEHVTRAFYARADLDLILSSPAAAHHLFAIRIASVAVACTAMTSLLAAPVINVAAYLGGAQYLWAYVVIAAMGFLATAIAVVSAVALFRSVGPKRTRLIAQIVAAVIGATFLIALQVAGIMLYGNMSRLAVLSSPELVAAMPAVDSLWWLPGKAMLGEPIAVLAFVVSSFALFALAVVRHAPNFGHHAVVASGTSDTEVARAGTLRRYTQRSTMQALRAKEWLLLKRDPWLLSQTLMQVLYLLPPAVMLWKGMKPGNGVDIILAPVLVMAFGQLAGGLAWLALSGEDAPELVATAPLKPKTLMRAKIESVLLVIAGASLPLVLGVALVSINGALMTALGIACASASAVAIQFWFKSAAKRSQFRRRQIASRAATFSEAFVSIFWAATTGFAVACYTIVAAVFAVFALCALGLARWISPREA